MLIFFLRVLFAQKTTTNVPMDENTIHKSHILHAEPRVVKIESLLSDDECQHIINLCEKGNRFSRSQVVEHNKASTKADGSRTSYSAFLRKSEDDVIRRIEERVSKLTLAPINNFESFQVVRYQPGQQFRPHHDYFQPNTPSLQKEQSRGGQRVNTIFIYLNDLPIDDAGGATIFPKLGLSIRPKRGMGVWWKNMTLEGKEDVRTLHGGEAPLKSIKYGLNVWSRQRAFG